MHDRNHQSKIIQTSNWHHVWLFLHSWLVRDIGLRTWWSGDLYEDLWLVRLRGGVTPRCQINKLFKPWTIRLDKPTALKNTDSIDRYFLQRQKEHQVCNFFSKYTKYDISMITHVGWVGENIDSHWCVLFICFILYSLSSFGNLKISQ